MAGTALSLGLGAVLLLAGLHKASDQDENTHTLLVPVGITDRTAFKPSMWGPQVWRVLHIMALNQPRYAEPDSKHFERYLYQLMEVLPCVTCRLEMAEILKRVPPHTFLQHGRAGAVGLIYVYHTLVSRRLYPQAPPATFLQEEAMLLREYASTADSPETLMKLLIIDLQLKGVNDLIQKALAQ